MYQFDLVYGPTLIKAHTPTRKHLNKMFHASKHDNQIINISTRSILVSSDYRNGTNIAFFLKVKKVINCLYNTLLIISLCTLFSENLGKIIYILCLQMS